MVVIYCYMERDNDEALKFGLNSFCFFELSASFFQALPSGRQRASKIFKIK